MEHENVTPSQKLKFFGLGKLIPYLKPYRGSFAIMIVCALLASLVDIVIPLFQRYAIDHFVLSSSRDGMSAFILFYILSLVFQVVTNAIAVYRACYLETYVARDLKNAAFSHLQTLSFSYFNQNSVGYLHARVISDTSRISGVVSWNLIDTVWMTAYIIGVVWVMLSIHARLALCVLALLPLMMLISGFYNKYLVRQNRKIREANSNITAGFNEGITGVKTIKVLSIGEKMASRFFGLTDEMKKESIFCTKLRSSFRAVISFASSLALALVLWRGGVITREGAMLIGTLSAFMTYAQELIDPVQWLVRTIADLIAVQVNIERFTAVMETESDVPDSSEVIAAYGDSFEPKQENWEALEGDIEFEDVSFRYPDGDEYVLEHFHLKVPAGTNVAIVGETGAGKSTLINLVCRFFEPTAGRILIDGRDARERSQLWLHSNIGYVLQTPHLFSGTIRENLLYGNPNATQEQMDEAVRLVHAQGVIERMEKGYDSEVGEGGDQLSTGEKQLLSFARAVLANPRIFVLDEATSSVDTMTEQIIQEATAKLMKGRTTFIVAHRLSTVRNADVILVVKDGKIIERGRHNELMQAKGHYFDLYTKQFAEDQIQKLLK